MATFDVCNSPVAPISHWGTHGLVVAKERTVANTLQTPDTKTKVEDVDIDDEFSDLSMNYTTQEFEFQKDDNYPQ